MSDGYGRTELVRPRRIDIQTRLPLTLMRVLKGKAKLALPAAGIRSLQPNEINTVISVCVGVRNTALLKHNTRERKRRIQPDPCNACGPVFGS